MKRLNWASKPPRAADWEIRIGDSQSIRSIAMTFPLGAYFELVFDQLSLEDFGGRQLFDRASHGGCESWYQRLQRRSRCGERVKLWRTFNRLSTVLFRASTSMFYRHVKKDENGNPCPIDWSGRFLDDSSSIGGICRRSFLLQHSKVTRSHHCSSQSRAGAQLRPDFAGDWQCCDQTSKPNTH